MVATFFDFPSPFRGEARVITAIAVPILLIIASETTLTSTAVVTRSTSQGGRCEPIEVAMCKGLIKYNNTRLPNKFGHRTQVEVYWALQPWWPFIDAGCSNNLRTFLCGLFLPKCVSAERDVLYPCQETCQKAKVRCAKTMRREGMRWIPEFRCQRLPRKGSRKCIGPRRETKKNKNRQYVLCEVNKLPMCRGIPFTQGSLPNMFLQGDLALIAQEMRQFQQLVDSGCSKKLRFLLCGVYMPFCVHGSYEDELTGRSSGNNAIVDSHRYPDVPFVVPCRELCQEVYDQCSGEYEQRTNGLPWPGKFHCHRFPSYVDRYDSDPVVNSNGTHGAGGRSNKKRGSSIPCTMPPYNYDGN